MKASYGYCAHIQRFHSLFYMPQFVTLHLGVLEHEELRVEVTTAESSAVLAVEMFLRGEADYLEQGQPVVERLVQSGRASVAHGPWRVTSSNTPGR